MEEVTEKIEDLTVTDEPAGDLSFAGKKKKKKKQVEGEVEEDAGESSAAVSTAVEPNGAEVEDGPDAEAVDLSLKQKKKKKVQIVEKQEDDGEPEDDEDVPEGEEDDEPAEAIELDGGPIQLPWAGSDRDYKYEELLDRVFRVLRAKNPEFGGLKRTVLKPPQVLREGTKKTVFANFTDTCKTMHRSSEHVMAFLLAELGTNGSLDGQQRLTIKGRFQPKAFEGILRRYVNEYVMCSMCKSSDTVLTKEQRLFFLRCEQCGSSRSVAPIKAGFVARIGRRKATA